jgi:hypothetical protein
MGALDVYAGGGFVRGDGCRLPAHYLELQALVDALSYAAQQEMSDAIRREDDLAGERAYGKWLGLRGLLRAIEGRTDEWLPGELAMLERIDWQREQFRFPGIESFEGPLTEPGIPSP